MFKGQKRFKFCFENIVASTLKIGYTAESVLSFVVIHTFEGP